MKFYPRNDMIGTGLVKNKPSGRCKMRRNQELKYFEVRIRNMNFSDYFHTQALKKFLNTESHH